MFKSFSQICEQAYLIDYGNSIDIETKIARIYDEKSVIEKTEEKINKLNSFLIDNITNKMKILKEEMKTIDEVSERIGRLNVMAEEAEQKVQRLDQDLKKIDTVSDTLKEVDVLCKPQVFLYSNFQALLNKICLVN